jgi:hypothetical protein
MTFHTAIRMFYLTVLFVAVAAIASESFAGTKCQSRTGSSTITGCSQDP